MICSRTTFYQKINPKLSYLVQSLKNEIDFWIQLLGWTFKSYECIDVKIIAFEVKKNEFLSMLQTRTIEFQLTPLGLNFLWDLRFSYNIIKLDWKSIDKMIP